MSFKCKVGIISARQARDARVTERGRMSTSGEVSLKIIGVSLSCQTRWRKQHYSEATLGQLHGFFRSRRFRVTVTAVYCTTEGERVLGD